MCNRLVLLLTLGLGVVVLTSATALGQAQVYDLVIAAGTDDAEEHLNAGMDITSSDLEIPYEDSGTPATDEQLIGMRWLVPMAQDFVIGKAYIEFELKETKGSTNTAPVNVIIEGELHANAPAFTTAAKNISNRTRTKAQVKWTIPTGLAVGARFQTPNITAIINEIVGQSGWASGNAVVIILRDDKSAGSTGLRCVHTYDGNVAGAPLLHLQPPWPWATNPEPADGAMGGDQPLLKWTPGEGAVLHNVYLGTSPELTEANLVARKQSFTMHYVPAFEPGMQYFWRIDEIDGTGKINTGTVWSFTVPSLKAYRPVPPEGSRYVPTDVTLTWSAGSGGVFHTVYLGTSFDDVNKASGGTPEPGTAYTPASPLAPATLYYWRVDESDGVTTHQGNVWSFTTLAEITITDPDLIGWWKFDEGFGDKAIDFSGHGNDGTFGGGVKWVEGFVGHAVQLTNGYVAIDGVVDDLPGTDLTLSIWIKTRQTNEGEVFAANDSASAHPLLFGISGRSTYVSDSDADTTYPPTINDDQWHMITYVRRGSTGTLYADGTQIGTYAATFDLSTVTRWSIGQEWDDTNPSNFYIGAVDDARFYRKALTADEVKELMRGDPLLAWKPSPGHRATVDVLTAEQGVTWAPGDGAAQHDVYFGTDQAAVTAAGTSDTTGVYRGRQDPASYTPPEGLPWGTGPYFWRIDEVQANGTVTVGRTWEFTVADYLIVDDFESYDEAEGTGTRLYETWIDGYTDSLSGSTVGNMDPPFAERTIVHGGRQSMPMDYNNVNPPYFSQAYREFSPLANWTVQGVTDLSLWVRGNPVPLAAVTETGGKMTVTGEGSDIWNDADEFTFVYKTLNGDGALIARVVSNGTGTNTWTKGGVMIRDGLEAGSTHAMTVMTGDVSAGNGCSFQYRLITDSASANADAAAALTLPYYVKIERTGDTVAGFVSPDGKTWTPQGVAQYLAMTAPACIGIAVTSHVAGEYRTFEFDNIKATGASGAWQTAEIGLTRNSPQPLYAIVADTAGKQAMVVDPNAAVVNTTTWTEWKIPLSDLAGVNLAKIKALYIGVGNRTNPTADGSGRVYIDDIRLTKSAGQ